MQSDLADVPPEVRESFNRFDADRNGFITREELFAVFRELDPQTWTEQALSSFWETSCVQADADKDGHLSLQEFLAWLYSTDGTAPLLQLRAQLGHEDDVQPAKTLRVRVKSAADLRNADYALFGGGRSDPYVVVQLLGADGKQVGEPKQTSVKDNELNPVWDEEFVFEDLSDPNKCKLVLEIFDSDSLFGLGGKLADRLNKDDALGHVEVTFEELEDDGEWKDRELDVVGGTGSLTISILNSGWGGKKLLEVRKVAAAGLRKTEQAALRGQLPNPYAILTVGTTGLRTNVAFDTTDPVWDDGVLAYPLDGEDSISLDVFDQGPLAGADGAMGGARMRLDDVELGRRARRTVSLGEGNGEISFELRLLSVSTQWHAAARKAADLLARQQAADVERFRQAAAEEAGDIVTVSILSASGLKDTDRGLFRRGGDHSDPYVIVQAGGGTMRTPVIKNCPDPVWNADNFSFTLLKDDDPVIRISVYDSDWLSSDELLGMVELDSSKLALGTCHRLEENLKEESGEEAQGSIDFTVQREGASRARFDETREALRRLARQQDEAVALARAKALAGAGDVLTVVVLEAHGLQNTERGLFRRSGDASDPYVVAKAGKQKFRSATVSNCLDPVWNSEPFSFTLGPEDTSVSFEVFDSDWLTFDDSLGQTALDVEALPSSVWVPLAESLGEGKGELRLRVRIERQEDYRVERAAKKQRDLEIEQDAAADAARSAAEAGAGDILTIVVLEAHGLQNTERGLFRRSGDSSDPYVFVKAGRQKFRSETISNNLDPVWNSAPFSFTLEPGSVVKFEVFDSDWLTFDDSLGKVELDVSDYPSGVWVPRTESLGEGKGELQFKVRLERQEGFRVDRAANKQQELEDEQAAAADAAKAQAEDGAGDICTVMVACARSLRNTDRGLFRRSGDNSDPYVVVSAGDQSFRTATVENDLSPVWNSQEFSLTLGEDATVAFTVYDSDLLTFDDELGSATLDVSGLEAGEWHDLTQSLGPGNGALDVKVRRERQIRARVERAAGAIAELAEEQGGALAAAKADAEEGAGYVAYVQVHAGHNLKETVNRMMAMLGDHSDPYVKVTVGEATLMTDIVNNDLNPSWDEDVFKFETDDAGPELKFECFDSDFFTHDDPMGEFSVDIAAFGRGEWKECRESLGDENGELSYRLRVERQPQKRLIRAQGERMEMWRVQQELREQRKQEALAKKA